MFLYGPKGNIVFDDEETDFTFSLSSKVLTSLENMLNFLIPEKYSTPVKELTLFPVVFLNTFL